jgi:hypothetical protein
MAIVFLTIAKKFRLAWKTGDWGTIVDIFIDGASIGQVDTYSAEPGQTYLDVLIPAETGFMAFDADPPTHELMIVHTGTHNEAATPRDGSYWMTPIRKELLESEVSPPQFRYDPETDTAQYSPDGGETWVDNPGADPRHNPAYQAPLPGGADPRCDAAATIVQRIKDVVDITIAAPTTLSQANQLLKYVLIFIPEIALIIGIIEVATNFLNILKPYLEASFTTEVYDGLTCLFDCGIHADGSVTAGDISAILALVEADYDDTVFQVVQFITQTWWGEVGTTNAGAVGTITGDCTDCDCGWCFEFDFTVSSGGFSPVNIGGTDFATWESGTGWKAHIQDDGCSNHAYIYITRPFGATIDNLGGALMYFTLPYYEGTVHFYDQNLAGSIVSRQSCGDMITSPQGVTLTPVPCDTLGITINGCNMSGGMIVQRVVFRGFGECPFGTPNCE